LQHAKARFSELVDDAVEKGPQIVTRRGVDTAVVVSSDEWQNSKAGGCQELERRFARRRSAVRYSNSKARHRQIARASGV